MANAIELIKNFYQPKGPQSLRLPEISSPLVGQYPNKQARFFPISRVQFERIRVDVQIWRQAIIMAENAYNPQRVDMHRIYQDTILNEHVQSCINRRKNLTLLRKFKLVDSAGNEDEEAVKLFKTTWFRQFQSYVLDSVFHGYNLISLGDVVNEAFPNLSFVRRQNVSPDRKIVTNFVYSMSGTSFESAEFKPWYIYVKTPTETGVSPSGYGLLYRVARTEIFLRNNSGQNADYNEVFGQPIRKGTTNKQAEERMEFENALRTMGSNAWIMLDEGHDTLELIEAASNGRAYETFKDFEKRGEAKISKIILGHADALDSTPGKLGAGQDGEDSPVAKALQDTQSEDSEFIQPIINDELIPRMRDLGFNIPEGLVFEYKNDEEKEAFRKREDESNKATAELFKLIKDAGGDLDEESWEYFEDRTGIPVKGPVPPPEPILPPGMSLNTKEDPATSIQKAISIKKQVKNMTSQQKQNLNGKAKHLR